MRHLLWAAPLVVAVSLATAGPSVAANPPGTGPPSQACQDLEPNTPGNAAESTLTQPASGERPQPRFRRTSPGARETAMAGLASFRAMTSMQAR